MARETWRQQIGGWIADALVEAQLQGLEGKALRAFVREKTYTGKGVAGCWGLKMWQQEFRHQVKGVPRPSRGVTRIAPAEGQGTLFE